MAAEDPTGRVNEMIARIDAADHAIDRSRAELAGACAALDALFVHNGWDDGIAPPDIEDEMGDLTGTVTQTLAALDTQIGATIDQGIALVEQIGEDIVALDAAWAESRDMAADGAEQFAHGLREALHDLRQAFGEMSGKIADAGEALASAGDAFDVVLTDWEQATSGDFAVRLGERFDDAVNDLAGDQTEKATRYLDEGGQAAKAAVDALLETASRIVDDLGHALGDALDRLQTHIATDIDGKLDEAMRTIVDTAIREMMQSIGDATATAALGVQITSAMSPILPQLIAVRKISDAILAAIRIWKDTIGRLIDIG